MPNADPYSSYQCLTRRRDEFLSAKISQRMLDVSGFSGGRTNMLPAEHGSCTAAVSTCQCGRNAGEPQPGPQVGDAPAGNQLRALQQGRGQGDGRRPGAGPVRVAVLLPWSARCPSGWAEAFSTVLVPEIAASGT